MNFPSMQVEQQNSSTPPTTENGHNGFDTFMKKLSKNEEYTPQQFQLIGKAYEFAKMQYHDQIHKSGMRLFDHCLAIAQMLVDLKVGTETIIVGFLHDIIKHSDVTQEEIEHTFGHSILELVLDVQRIRALKVDHLREQQLELQWFFEKMTKDVRVAIIRMVHRLYDLEHMEWRNLDYQKKMAEETLEIFVPIADRLGIGSIRSRFENVCFRYLQPEIYSVLKDQVEKVQNEDKICLELVLAHIRKILIDNGVKAQVAGRLKSIYSIYRKMIQKQCHISKVLDKLGLRVIVDTIPECYTTLGIIHTQFTPIPGAFDDYIGLPKPNNYQSLHTCIYPLKGISYKPIEIQIRTQEMHIEAEYGAAAHWKYKSSHFIALTPQEQLQWIRNLVRLKDRKTRMNTYNNFVTTLKTSLFDKTIIIFDETGKVTYMPKGSTPSDFAVLKNIAIDASYIAKINGRLSDLSRILKDGDTVEICKWQADS